MKYSNEQLDGEVLFLLRQHKGKGNSINRWDLVAMLFGPQMAQDQNDGNFADRQIRESVERLRQAGVLICDMGDGSGRYLAASAQEYQEFRLRYGSRAFKIMETLRSMDKSAQDVFEGSVHQPSLFSVEA